MPGLERVVIVGASLAGLRAAEELRARGYSGTITMIGAEKHLPYDRPPLSKQYLAGTWDLDRIVLRSPDDLAALELDLRLGRRAERLDPVTRTVVLDDGEPVTYDGLVIATGATPRLLPGVHPDELDGVHLLRTLDDATLLRAAFEAGPQRVVVIGAGFIGAEVAATARQRGLDVTLLEALPVPVVRGLGEQMGNACALVHGDHGVDLRCNVTVSAVDGRGRVERVLLGDGTVIEADLVVVGVGVRPAIDWLADSGLELRDGVVCDATCAAGPPGVYAAGDLARWHNPLFDEEMRLEHWTNASEQGAHVAANLMREATGEAPEPFAPVPFFWSDQYDRRIQFLGRTHPDATVTVVHGSVEERKFVALYGYQGRLIGALGMSLPRLLMPYRQLLAERATIDQALEKAKAQ